MIAVGVISMIAHVSAQQPSQSLDQANILPINISKAHTEGQQGAIYMTTFQQIITTCSLEPDGSVDQADCNSFLITKNINGTEIS
jgi:hypothetical protein